MLASRAKIGRDRQWHVLVVEDADEFLSADAKARTGQALSRLLNVTNGLVGQGLRILLLLTTNEEAVRMHPAVVRAGRCLADVEFRPLPPDEAKAWLRAKGAHQECNAAMVLSDLYALVRGGAPTLARPLGMAGR